MTTDTIQVVWASDIPGCTDVQWNDFSYGDASHTLVDPENLINELDSDEPGHADLIEELSKVPAGVLVAFNG